MGAEREEKGKMKREQEVKEIMKIYRNSVGGEKVFGPCGHLELAVNILLKTTLIPITAKNKNFKKKNSADKI